MDAPWWRVYLEEVKASFQGERYSHGTRPGVTKVRAPYFQLAGLNSGACAIALALHFGARAVYLLGYDCQRTSGQSHWHGDHPRFPDAARRLGNAGSIDKWPDQFRKLGQFTGGARIINCSRATALTVYPRAHLEDVL